MNRIKKYLGENHSTMQERELLLIHI